MTRGRRIVVAAVVIVLLAAAALVAVGLRYRPLLLTGTGYAAHNACAVHFLADRSDPESDLPDNPLLPYLRTTIDDDRGSATTSILGVGFQQTAHLSDHGCTLGDPAPGTRAVPPETPPATTTEATGGIALPVAADVPAGVHRALDEAATVEGTRGLVVVHAGELLGERYADRFAPDTRQLGWSMTKSVAATLVGRAQQEYPGADLDPARTELRPEWTDERADISLADLLRMTSGLEWDKAYDLGTPVTRMLYQEGDMASYAADQPSAHTPGTFRQYSSGTTNIVCDLLHAETGLGPEMADVLLFDELGMSSAVLEPDAAGGSVCSSYLWATPRDWAKFGQFALDDGVVHEVDDDGTTTERRLLPRGWMDYATEVVPAGGEPEPYGAQW